jgi:hypothetical protein
MHAQVLFFLILLFEPLSCVQFVYINPGVYVRIVLSEVPTNAVAERLREYGHLTVFGLLRHENKLSVLNFMVQRTNTYQEPIRSKDRLIIQVRNMASILTSLRQ